MLGCRMLAILLEYFSPTILAWFYLKHFNVCTVPNTMTLTDIIKGSMYLICRVGSISKRLLHWLYYNLHVHVYISHNQVHLAHIKTYQVFLSIANSTGNVNICSNIAGVRNCLTWKVQNLSFSFFFLSPQKLYYATTPWYDKLLGQI